MLSASSSALRGLRAATSARSAIHVKPVNAQFSSTNAVGETRTPLVQQWMRSFHSTSKYQFQDTDFTARGTTGSSKISSEEFGDLLGKISSRGGASTGYSGGEGAKRSEYGYGHSNSSRFGGSYARKPSGWGNDESEGPSSGYGGAYRAQRGPRDEQDRYGARNDSYGRGGRGQEAKEDAEGGQVERSGYGERRSGYGADRYESRGYGGDRGDRFRPTGARGGYGGGYGGGSGDFGRGERRVGSSLRAVDFTEENLPPVNKCLHKENETVANMTEEAVKEWRQANSMEIIGKGCPRPIMTFEQTSFPSFIQKQLTKMYPAGPSPIQSQGWPLSSSGRDVVASAQTGSGKTIAFVLPALEHIFGQPPIERGKPGADQPVALFLAPTRELAMQINEETKRFTSFYGFRTACVYGGQQNRFEQTRQLVAKPHIIVATPGRLIDFVESKLVNLARVSYVVLDEADRMLDMGFEPQVRAVLGQIRPDRQTLMWSATWPKRVQDLANQFLKDPVRVKIGSDELSANPNVKQEFQFTGKGSDRLDRLLDILAEKKSEKILIFTSTKINAELLTDELYDAGHKVQALHGDKAQAARTRILSDFKTGRAHVLIATDVAARGIDVSDIQCVINYNMPNNSEDYVHRIGRTGRAGKTGISISFFTEDDESLIPELIPILQESQQEIPEEFEAFMSSRRAARANALRGSGNRRGSSDRRPARRFQRRY